MAANVGIQAYNTLNQPTGAANYNLSYLDGSGVLNTGVNSGCCPEKQGPRDGIGPGSSYNDLKNDPLIGVKAFSGLFELTGIGELYMLGRTAYIGTVRPLLVDGLKYTLTKVGYKFPSKTVVSDQILPRSEPIMRSLGAASRADMLAKSLKLNINSATTRQLLNSLDDPVESFISRFRKPSIRSEFPGEYLNKTVEEALLMGELTCKESHFLLLKE